MYNEKYRNQFHFSPLYGWMNDINGCWYQNGVYHMTYQARSEETDNGNGIYKTYCPVQNGMLKLRVLIDEDCVDLIIGDGENVYLEEFGFEPERLDWSVTADGSVKISEAFGFEMNSAY